jgi:hypothetical protein
MIELKTDADLVQVLDVLKHRLKPLVADGSQFARLFNFWLNGFVLRYGLDQDSHAFVAIPKDGFKIPEDAPTSAFLLMLGVLEKELRTGVSSELNSVPLQQVQDVLDMKDPSQLPKRPPGG